MTLRPFAAAAAVAMLGALVAGCGYKGPLTLPEKTGPVVIRPAPTATPPPTAPSATAPGESPMDPAATQVSPTSPSPEDEEKTRTKPASPGSAPAAPPAPEGTPAGG